MQTAEITAFATGKTMNILDAPKEVMDFLREFMGGLQQDTENQVSWTIQVGEARLTFIRNS